MLQTGLHQRVPGSYTELVMAPARVTLSPLMKWLIARLGFPSSCLVLK